MKSLRTALLAEGSSDKVLIPILSWLLSECLPPTVPFDEPMFIEPFLLEGVGKELVKRIPKALEEQPCDLLFVHRDADTDDRKAGMEHRLAEIRAACASIPQPPVVCVVPVQETESWLLLDETAIWAAAGRTKGAKPLDLPKAKNIERLADPKKRLKDLIRQTGCTHFSSARALLPSKMSDYTLLRQLSAFRELESATRAAVSELAP